MPYKTNNDLPDSVKNHLPKEAQDIYRKVYNSAYEQYKNQPINLTERSARIAWAAVKRLYRKNTASKWVVR